MASLDEAPPSRPGWRWRRPGLEMARAGANTQCGWWPQTKSSTNPHLALLDAMRDLKNEFKDLDSAFEAAVTTYKDKTNAGAMDY